MRQRQMEFYQEWDQEEAMQRKSLMDEEGNSKFHEELEGDDDDGRAEAEALEAEAQAKEEEEEQSEPVSPHLIFMCCLFLTVIADHSSGVQHGANAAEP